MKIIEIKDIKFIPKKELKNFRVVPKVLLEWIYENKSTLYVDYVNKIFNILGVIINYNNQPIKKDILYSYAKKDYKKIVDLFVKLKIVSTDFADFDGLIKERPIIYEIKDFECTYCLLEKNLETKNKVDESLLNEYSRDALYNSEIYFNEAFLSEINKKTGKPLISRLNSLLRFALKNHFYAKGKTVNRVYNSFSLLSKISREWVHYNNKPFLEIDISNCQPLLLASVLLNSNYDIDQQYIDAVCNGTFYDSLTQQEGEISYYDEFSNNKPKKKSFKTLKLSKTEGNKDMKILCYKFIFFCKKLQKNEFSKIFKSIYPKTYDALKDFTSTSENKLAHTLQNLEAEILLTIIPQCPYFTVHDSISILDYSYEPIIKEKILNKIKEFSNNKITNISFGKSNLTVKTYIENVFTENSYIESNVIEIPDKKQIKHKVHKEHIHKNKDYHDKIVELLNNNESVTNIANLLGLTKKTIYNFKQKL